VKKFLGALTVGWVLASGLWAEEAGLSVVTPEEAGQHEGETVTVKGRVEGQRTTGSGTTFLNFGGRYPNQVFSCRAFAEHFPGGVPTCEGKTVEVTGLIKMYEGKPTIDLKGPASLKVLEAEGGAETPAP
jgi:DNA/RNA endonuclease YhcR with UshA esterase domain